ncbi:hypothetical protein ACLKA6_013390 [Drosophila palustris]
MLYCTSLRELRDQMMTYEKTRKVTAPVFGRNNEITKGRPSAKIVTARTITWSVFRMLEYRYQYAQCPKRKMTTTIAAVQDDESLGETNEDELAAVQSIKL